MDKFKGKNIDFEIIEDSGVGEVDEIRLIDTDQLSDEVIQILQNEDIDIDLKIFQHIFAKIYQIHEGMFHTDIFIDDLHEECDYEGLNISYTMLESALSEVIEELGEEIIEDPVRLLQAFVAQLKQRVIIR